MSAVALVDELPGTNPRYFSLDNSSRSRKTGRTVFSSRAFPASPLGLLSLNEGKRCVFPKTGLTTILSVPHVTTEWEGLIPEDLLASSVMIRDAAPWVSQTDSQFVFLPILNPWDVPRVEFPFKSAPAKLIDLASKFWQAIPFGVRLPTVWAEEGEIAFEWKWGERHAILSIEEDGTIGYAMDVGGQFSPGSEIAKLDALPRDLLKYLADK